MSINLRQIVAASLGSLVSSMGFIGPVGAEVFDADLLNTSTDIAHIGNTHRDSFTDLLEFRLASTSFGPPSVTAYSPPATTVPEPEVLTMMLAGISPACVAAKMQIRAYGASRLTSGTD